MVHHNHWVFLYPLPRTGAKETVLRQNSSGVAHKNTAICTSNTGYFELLNFGTWNFVGIFGETCATSELFTATPLRYTLTTPFNPFLMGSLELPFLNRNRHF